VCRKVGFSVKKRGRFACKPAKSPVLGKFNFPDRHFRPALFFVAFSKESKERENLFLLYLLYRQKVPKNRPKGEKAVRSPQTGRNHFSR
ncbi:MAG: hypothetical protein RSB29_06515, partial [Alistipes sp.]